MNIGVLAFGFMGRVHCEAYHNIPNARGSQSQREI